MKVIQLILEQDQDPDHFIEEIIDKAVERSTVVIRRMLEDAHGNKSKPLAIWIGTHEAMQILGVKSKKKMQELRDNSPMNGIVISKNGRNYLYNRASLLHYIQDNIIK